MNYETFSHEVAVTAAAKRAVDEFAKEQAGGCRICPRCGHLTIKDRLATNALSRHADVYICDACGMDEAVRDFKGVPLPLMDWAIAEAAPHVRHSDVYKRTIRGDDCCPFWRADEGGICKGWPGGDRICTAAPDQEENSCQLFTNNRK